MEGGTALGGTGVSGGGSAQAGAGGAVTHGTTDGQPRTGDTQARRDNIEEGTVQPQPKKRAKRKQARDATGATTSGRTY